MRTRFHSQGIKRRVQLRVDQLKEGSPLMGADLYLNYDLISYQNCISLTLIVIYTTMT